MEFQDRGITLSASRYGESDALLEVLTESHGRHRGYVRGGSGRRQRSALQPGNELSLRWRSRLSANLGVFTPELIQSPLGGVLGDGDKLAGLSAAAAILMASLPEREAHPPVFHGFRAFLQILAHSEDVGDWSCALVQLETGLLQELGFGLDFTSCAATGNLDDLIYVSPRTGRAVSRDAGRPYAGRLLPLPQFLLGRQAGAATLAAALEGFQLTGFFIERHLLNPVDRALPAARYRLIDRLERRARKTGEEHPK